MKSECTKAARDLLIKLGRPFKNDLRTIVNYAMDVLDGREDKEGSASLIEELLKIEEEWKTVNAVQLKRMAEFLENQGLIPLGTRRDALA